MIVIGSGTCGTLTGVGRKVKEKVKNCKVRTGNVLLLLTANRWQLVNKNGL